MRRKLFTLAAGTSAVLCAGVAIMWVVVRWHPVRYERSLGVENPAVLGTWLVTLDRDGIFYVSTRTDWATGGPLPPRRNVSYVHKVLGLRYGVSRQYRRGSTFTARYAAMPYWMPLSATALLPAAWLVARRTRKPTAGLCPRCGYDLRATPERCPECGIVVSAKEGAGA